MSYKLQIKLSDDTAEALRIQAGDTSLSEYVRPTIEDLAQGILHPPQQRSTPLPRDTSGDLTTEAIREMVLRNEAKGHIPLQPHVLQSEPRPFALLPWNHDDALRPRINTFRRDIKDRNACLKMLGKGRKTAETH